MKIPALLWRLSVACALAATMTNGQAGLLGKLVGGATRAGAARENKVYDANTLRPPELKSCLLMAHQIDAAVDSVKLERTNLDMERGLLESSAKAGNIKTKKDVAAYRAKEKAFNEKIDALNTQIASLKSDNGKFQTSCAGKRYFQSDFKAVSLELPANVQKQIAAGT